MAFPCFFHRQSAGWRKGEGVSGVIILVPRSFASPGQSLEISVNNCRTKIINQRFPAQAPIFIHTHIYIYIYLFITIYIQTWSVFASHSLRSRMQEENTLVSRCFQGRSLPSPCQLCKFHQGITLHQLCLGP